MLSHIMHSDTDVELKSMTCAMVGLLEKPVAMLL